MSATDLLRDVPRVGLTSHWPELDGQALPERFVIESRWTGLSVLSPMIRRHELALSDGRYSGTFLAGIGGMSSAAGQIVRREARAESAVEFERARLLLDSLRALRVFELPSDTWPQTRRMLLRELTSLNETTCSHDAGLLELRFGSRTLRLERKATHSPWWVMDNGPVYPVVGQALDNSFEKLCAGLDESAFEVLESPLSEPQKVEEVGDGRHRITAIVQDTERLRWWLLGFGGRVEVLAPKALRDEMATRTAEATARYQQQAPQQEQR